MKAQVKSERHFQIELNLMSNSDPRYAQPSLCCGKNCIPVWLWMSGEAPRWSIKLFYHCTESINTKTTGNKCELDFVILLHMEVLLTLLGILNNCRIK